jgi:pyruvate oxidase
MNMNLAEALIQQLDLFGVKYIFGVSGDANLPLLTALSKQSNIRYIGVRHESAAGFMASAHGKLTGKLGVCLATSGPGMANLLNGLGDAYGDKVPVLAITGQVPTTKIGTNSKQYIDQQRFIEPLAAYSSLVTSTKSFIPVLNKAIQTAVREKAVAHLSIPKDLFLQSFDDVLIPSDPYLYLEAPSHLNEIPKAVDFLNTCQRPAILVGRGALGCGKLIEQLANQLGAGIVLSLGAKGIIPESYECTIGGIGEGGSMAATNLIGQCDGLIIVGASWYPKTFMPSSIPFIQIESRKDQLHLDKNLVLGLIGDTKEIVTKLLEVCPKSNNQDWTKKVQQAREQWRQEIAGERDAVTMPLSPAHILQSLEKYIASDAIISLDTGDHTIWFNRVFQANQQTVLFSGNWRTLGFGLPAANLAQLVLPHRQVVALIGDGGFAMNMAELATCAKYNLPIKMIIFNNHSYALEKNRMETMNVTPFGTELLNPNFAKLAESFGLEGLRVEQPNQLEQAMKTAFQSRGTVLVDIICSTTPTPLSRVQAVSSI